MRLRKNDKLFYVAKLPITLLINNQLSDNMRILLLNILIIYSTVAGAQINYESYLHKCDSLVQLNVGKQFPSFTAITLKGDIVSDKDLLGRVTIFNFWFRYCEPCIAEFDALNGLYQQFRDDKIFQFISFTSDAPEVANTSVIKYKLLFPVCSISEKECFRLNFNQGFPTTIIVDKFGKIALIKTGGSLEKEKIAVDIQKFTAIINNLL